MSKPPPKGTTGTPPTSQTAPTSSVSQGTRSATAALAAGKKPHTSPPKSVAKASAANNATNDDVAEGMASTGTTSQASPLRQIADTLAHIVSSERMGTSVKKELEEVIKYAREAEAKEKAKSREVERHPEVSDIRKAVKADLLQMYASIQGYFNQVQATSNATLANVDKVAKEAEEIKASTKDLATAISKVTDATDKIASETTTYRDALLTRPAQANRAGTDPKVLSDMERRSRQILVDVYGEEGDNLLTKSLTEIVGKANEALGKVSDASKPKEVKVMTVTKMRGHALLFTLNSKEAAVWVKEIENEIAFMKEFSEGSQIRARTFNLIVPQVPITFDPKEGKHLREIEEVNGLVNNSISKAKWIKPLERRRPDQTHAYAILTLTLADAANTLIRDGVTICQTRVRPKKQKQEPIQCLKCRGWGHFATECKAAGDTCGNCGGNHRTNTCKNKEKVYCVTCSEYTHASWSRNCPEFNRRCAIMDEKNPENAMPYFPTEHDWTLMVRPERIPLEVRFPAKYAVNNLASAGGKHPGLAPRPPRRKRKQGAAEEGGENPNLIPINQNGERDTLPVEEEPRRNDFDGANYGAANTDEDFILRDSSWD